MKMHIEYSVVVRRVTSKAVKIETFSDTSLDLRCT